MSCYECESPDTYEEVDNGRMLCKKCYLNYLKIEIDEKVGEARFMIEEHNKLSDDKWSIEFDC